jgi:hypothetical protein
MKFFKRSLFLFSLFGIIFLFSSSDVFAQSLEIEEINSPTNKNLRSVHINGNDIYVFGDDCFAAKSTNNGDSWEILDISNCEGNIKSAYVSSSNGDIIIVGDSFVRRKNTSYVAWGEISNFTEKGGFHSVQADSNGNVYLFPVNNTGFGTSFKGINTSSPYNFYLPSAKTFARIGDYTYRGTSISGNNLITFLHVPSQQGTVSSVLTSSDGGDSWTAGNLGFDKSSMHYISDSSFNGSDGFFTGTYMARVGLFIYKSSDSGGNWSFVSSKTDRISPKSIHTIDSNNFVVVGSRDVLGDARVTDWTGGFLMTKSGNITNFDQVLNHVSGPTNYNTGVNDEMIAVGNGGKIFRIKLNYPEETINPTNPINPTTTSNISLTIDNFIDNGVDQNTIKLGRGERMAVISSYQVAFGRMPENDMEINDLIKIANGRWPSITSANAENNAKAWFRNIYKREANMNNANDNAAVTIMAYGLRQRAENRNLNSESAGLKTFRAIYNRVPQSTQDWNILQAITYSGATR